ncbi:unnamed protein product [Moneuplotes crassus]|uniref:Chromo domain-containing protein n=1 Tax=Euplotes crassus TaxID=5936 RepID=A0AAD1Y157_EUPCR|nr:unnamed protein product [Moneuplotes crassus]
MFKYDKQNSVVDEELYYSQPKVESKELRRSGRKRIQHEEPDFINIPIKYIEEGRDIRITSIVEEILDFRVVNNKKEFLLKWKGYPEDFSTWCSDKYTIEEAPHLALPYLTENYYIPKIALKFVKKESAH